MRLIILYYIVLYNTLPGIYIEYMNDEKLNLTILTIETITVLQLRNDIAFDDNSNVYYT